MKIKNVRIGFACNSSSSHSLLILNENNKKLYDYDVEDQNFGWQEFLAASEKSKRTYLAICALDVLRRFNNHNLNHQYNCLNEFKPLDDALIAYVEKIFNVELKRNAFVDHQSRFEVPLRFDRTGVHKDYVKDLIKYIAQDKNIVICGGNSNNHYSVDVKNNRKIINNEEYTLCNINPPKDIFFFSIARKDGDWYTLFDPINGNRITFSFKTNPLPLKLSSPYLVDINITDFCPFECKYCYRGSSIEGKFANLGNLMSIIFALSKLEVFEVALGGGEPFSHPNIDDIITTIHGCGIVPNITTHYNINTLAKKQFWNVIKDKLGKIAFSISHPYEITDIVNQAIYHSIPLNKISFQVIENVFNPNLFEDAVDLCVKHGVTITLLGFKPIGRGINFKKEDDINWLPIWEKYSKTNGWQFLQVDTSIIKKYKNKIKKANVFKESYHEHEGMYSMYIDAVNNMMYKSSYELSNGKQLSFDYSNPSSLAKQIKQYFSSLQK